MKQEDRKESTRLTITVIVLLAALAAVGLFYIKF
jgi:hypothetical protein